MNILVTGGAGYIGSHVVLQLIEKGYGEIAIVDNLTTGLQESINRLQNIANARNTTLTFIKLDLSNWNQLEKVFEAHEFDAVMHFAGSLIVPESISDPLKYYLNNTANTANLLQLCLHHRVNKFIFSSTASVYGNPAQSEKPIRESCAKRPINPYGRSKLMSETMINDAASANADFRYVILRYFNVAGADPKGRIGQSTLNATHLIKVAAETALGKRKSMSIFGNDYSTPDGTCIRDYIHVHDLASAHIAAMNYLVGSGCKNEVLNCGYGHGLSVKEVVDMMKIVSKTDFRVQMSGRRAGDPEILVSDCGRIKKVLGWTPHYDDLSFICKTALEWEKRK